MQMTSVIDILEAQRNCENLKVLIHAPLDTLVSLLLG